MTNAKCTEIWRFLVAKSIAGHLHISGGWNSPWRHGPVVKLCKGTALKHAMGLPMSSEKPCSARSESKTGNPIER